MLLGFAHVKAASRLLLKSTPGLDGARRIGEIALVTEV